MNGNKVLHDYFEQLAPKRSKWKKRNRFYHKILEKHISLIIPEGSRVLELGCGTGDLLNSVKPSVGVGIDFSEKMIAVAKEKYPNLKLFVADAADYKSDLEFDYIILSDLLNSLWDIQAVLHNLKSLADPHKNNHFSI